MQIPDLISYLQLPHLNKASAIALATSLASWAPKEAPPAVQKAAESLAAATRHFQGLWADRERSIASADRMATVVLDRELDNSVSLLHARLASYERLPAERYPNATRAGELRRQLFGDGLGFIRASFTEEWAHCDTLIKRIDSEGLAEDLAALAGPEFLAELRYSHQQFGRALGKTAPLADEPDPVNLLEATRNLADAIRQYTLQVIATADGDRPDTVQAAHAALKPIADLREELARRRTTPSEKRAATEPEPG